MLTSADKAIHRRRTDMATKKYGVFGYFTDQSEAEKAKGQLQQAGFDEIELSSVNSTRTNDDTELEVSFSVTNQLDSAFSRLSHPQTPNQIGVTEEFGADFATARLLDSSAGGPEDRRNAWIVVAVTDGSDTEVE